MRRATPGRAPLRCPRCRGRAGSAAIEWLRVDTADGDVIAAGLLGCSRCDAEYPVVDGIAEIARAPIGRPEDPTLDTWIRTDWGGVSLPSGLTPDPSPIDLLAPAETILELGCGTGATAVRLAEHADFVLGLDIRASRIEIALQHTTDRCDFLVADATDPPVAGESWDAVVALNLFDTIHDPDLLLLQAGALLRPGGQLLLSSPFQWSDLSPHHGTPPTYDLKGHLEAGRYPLEVVKEEDRLWVVTDNDRRFYAYRTRVVLALRR